MFPENSVQPRCPQCNRPFRAGTPRCMWCGQDLRQVPLPKVTLMCPVCTLPLQEHQSAEYTVHFCGQCKGLWVPSASLAYLETQFANTSVQRETSGAEPQASKPVELYSGIQDPGTGQPYRRCPQCGQQMARRVYRRISRVIVDTCLGHGVWFDAHEFQSVLRFLESGGLKASQAEGNNYDASSALHQNFIQRMRSLI